MDTSGASLIAACLAGVDGERPDSRAGGARLTAALRQEAYLKRNCKNSCIVRQLLYGSSIVSSKGSLV
jgi:hypothetical protein